VQAGVRQCQTVWLNHALALALADSGCLVSAFILVLGHQSSLLRAACCSVSYREQAGAKGSSCGAASGRSETDGEATATCRQEEGLARDTNPLHRHHFTGNTCSRNRIRQLKLQGIESLTTTPDRRVLVDDNFVSIFSPITPAPSANETSDSPWYQHPLKLRYSRVLWRP
jgi:hypothetical protein